MRLGISTLVLDHHLTRKGARLLDDQGCDVRRSLLDGIDKERGAGWRFVEHTVSIAGFFVELEVALRARTDMRLLGRSEILEDAMTARASIRKSDITAVPRCTSVTRIAGVTAI